jgi:hypothetical protein
VFFSVQDGQDNLAVARGTHAPRLAENPLCILPQDLIAGVREKTQSPRRIHLPDFSIMSEAAPGKEMRCSSTYCIPCWNGY